MIGKLNYLNIGSYLLAYMLSALIVIKSGKDVSLFAFIIVVAIMGFVTSRKSIFDTASTILILAVLLSVSAIYQLFDFQVFVKRTFFVKTHGFELYMAFVVVLGTYFISLLFNKLSSSVEEDTKAKAEDEILYIPSCDIFPSFDKMIKHTQIKGKRWSCINNILEFNKQQKEKWGDRTFKFSTIKYFDVVENKVVDKIDKYDTDIGAEYSMKDLTESIFAIGKTGSGKTYAILQLLNQIMKKKLAKRYFFHDFKGDYSKILYRNEKDIIISLQDKRAKTFDIWAETEVNILRISKFFMGLVESVAGKDDKSKFFNQAAHEYIMEAYHAVILNNFKSKNVKKNWNLFFEKFERIRTKKDSDIDINESAMTTAIMTINVLYTIATRHISNLENSFTVSDFLENEDVRLFMLNKSEYAQVNGAYFTGVINAILDAKLSERDYSDDEEEYTVFVLDEVFCMNFESFKEAAKTVRSKQGCLIYGTQAYPISKEDRTSITQSRNLSLIFNTQDEEAKKDYATTTFKKGQVRIDEIKITKNTSSNGGSTSKTKNIGYQPVDICSESQIESTPKQHFINYVANDNLLFYSKAISDEIKNESGIIDDKEYELFLIDNMIDINKEYHQKIQWKQKIKDKVSSKTQSNNKILDNEVQEEWIIEDEMLEQIILNLQDEEDEEVIMKVIEKLAKEFDISTETIINKLAENLAIKG